MLAAAPTGAAMGVFQAAVHDPDPIVRIGALRGMELLDPDRRYALAKHLLQDDIRLVRTEAARALAAVSPASVASSDRPALQAALQEYVDLQLFNADRPESFANLGNFYRERRMPAEAESAYVKAIALAPDLAPAYVNLADLYRSLGREPEGERLLRQALSVTPDFAAAHHALGLLLVREQRREEAMRHLKRAFELAPEDMTFGYVYGLGLNSLGKPNEALRVLEETLKAHPYDQSVLLALVTINREQGRPRAAQGYAAQLVELYPENPEYRQLLGHVGEMP
jgi:tetratricopeptide (TPR) repeat protein